MQKTITNMTLVTLAACLFEPAFFYESLGFYLNDIFLFITIILFSSLIFSRPRIYDYKGINLGQFIFLFFCLALTTGFALLKYESISHYIFIDLWRIFKLFSCILIVSVLKPNNVERLYLKIIFFVKLYIILTLLMNTFQFLNPSSSLFSAVFSRAGHFYNLGNEQFGFIGNPSHAGMFMFVSLSIMLLNKNYIYLAPGLIALGMHGNKMSIFLSIFLIFMFFFAEKKRLFMKFIFIFLVVIVATPVLIETINRIEMQISGELAWRSIEFRFIAVYYVLDLFRDPNIDMIFAGYPDKNDWPKSFDMQYLLMIARFGLLGMLTYYLILFTMVRSSLLTKLPIMLLITSGITINTSFEGRLSFYCSILLLVTFYVSSLKEKNRNSPSGVPADEKIA